MGLVQYGSQAYRLDGGNLLSTVTYRNIGAWQSPVSIKRYSSLVSAIVKDAPQVLGNRGYYDLDGAIYTARAGFTSSIFW